MADETEIAALTLRALYHRGRASHARGLAEQIDDAHARHRLLQYAGELEQQAKDLDLAAAALKGSVGEREQAA